MTGRVARVPRRLPTLVWLWLLWLLLWGSVSAATVLGGLLLAAGLVAAFGLPPAHTRVRLRPLALARLVARILPDLARSAATVGWAAVRYGPRVPSGVVAVRLSTDSDLLVALTAQLITMTPGSLVVEIDRDRLLLYVHCLPVRSPREAERHREDVRRAERAVARALGGTHGTERSEAG